jgi:hypothetical protein
MTYGHRESRDALSAYLYLTGKYANVYAMGSSVGAAAILIALSEMPKLAGVIAENPFSSFQRLIMETPASRSIPTWFTHILINVAMLTWTIRWTTQRGDFTAFLESDTHGQVSCEVPRFLKGQPRITREQ